jgi:hypothetical protein
MKYLFCFILGISSIGWGYADVAQDLQTKKTAIQYGDYATIGWQDIDSVAARTMMQDYAKDMTPNYIVRNYYTFPVSDFKIADQLEVYNKLISFPSLDATYIVRKGKKTPFLSQVSVLDQTTLQKISLQPLTAIPQHANYLLVVKDAKFGQVKYQIETDYQDGMMLWTMTNVTKINYFGQTLAEPYDFKTQFILYQQDAQWLLIAQSVMNIPKLEQASNSIDLKSFFSKRLEGLKTWYMAQVFQVVVKQGVFPRPIQIES